MVFAATLPKASILVDCAATLASLSSDVQFSKTTTMNFSVVKKDDVFSPCQTGRTVGTVA